MSTEDNWSIVEDAAQEIFERWYGPTVYNWSTIETWNGFSISDSFVPISSGPH